MTCQAPLPRGQFSLPLLVRSCPDRVLRTAIVLGLVVACSKSNSSPPSPAAPAPSVGAPPAAAPAPSRGPEHAVFALDDNRLLGHRLRQNGLLMVTGSAGFPKYIRFGKGGPSWQFRERDGHKVAIARGAPRFVFPLTALQSSSAQTIWLHTFGPGARRAGFRFNNNPKTETTVELAAGWSTAQLTVPQGALRPGENEILIFLTGGPTEIEWLQVGGSSAADAVPTLYDPTTGQLMLADGDGLAWYLQLPEHTTLTADLADAKCEVAVQAVSETQKTVAGTLRGVGSGVSLEGLGGQAVRLELVAHGCPQARLAKAAIVVPGAAATARKGAKPKYVVLVVMDSLRADRVRPFNPKARPKTPTFEALAQDSAMFLQNYVQGNESRVSHASIWSSLYPIKHQMLGASSRLALKWTTIDEVAKAAGLYAAGVSANGYVDPKRWGMGEKWDRFSNHIHEKKGLKGEDVLAAGLELVAGKKEPWLLYMGWIDTHVSWRAKAPWMAEYDPKPYSGKFKDTFSGADAQAFALKRLAMSERDKEHVRAIYDSNVSYQDRLLGELIAKLKEWGVWDETMLIVTGDHGDEQWEDGRMGHGGSLREALEHVPLVVHYPPLIPPGLYQEGTEVVDIVPTIADALGVPQDGEWQGQSLIPVTQGIGAGYPRLSFASNQEYSHAGRLGPWKLFTPGGGSPKLYDLSANPEETHDVSAASAFGLRAVADPLWLLRAYNLTWKKAVWGNAANVSAAFARSFGE